MIEVETERNDLTHHLRVLSEWARRSSLCLVLLIQVIILQSGYTLAENLAIAEGNLLLCPYYNSILPMTCLLIDL